MDPHRPELHAFGFRAILEVAAEMLTPKGIEEILTSLGVSTEEFHDPNAWFSAQFAEDLIATISEKSGDPSWLARAMRLGLSARYLGILYPILHSFGTPGFAYRQVVKEAGRFNKLVEWSMQEERPQYVRLIAKPIPGSPPERTPVMCLCRSTQIAAIPTLFDLPPAELSHPECIVRGAAACVYEVRWREQRRRMSSWLGLGLGAALGAIVGYAYGLHPPYIAMLSLCVGAAVWSMARVRELAREITDRMVDITEHQDALARSTRAHEERFQELIEAKTAVEQKVEVRTAELRDASRRLRETLEEVQALSRARTDFFNNVSHELRSPLTLILAPLEDLVAGRSPPGGEQSAFEAMHRNAARLLRLINQLLDLAKVDAGEPELLLVPTDLAALLKATLSAFQPAAQKKGVGIGLRLPPVPGAPILVDGAWIESAITNLVANALRLTKPDGEVRVVLADESTHVTIAVSDDGPGIAAEDQARVFERFAQGDSTKRLVGGTGIGLALVREAVRLHGGEVELRSELGKGATFTLRLPRRQVPIDADVLSRTAVSERPRSVVIDEFRREKESSERSGPRPDAPLALVVEDNADLREFIADVLATGYRVQTAMDGANAIALAARIMPDVVVSDVAMPEMDGYELCRTLRAKDETRTVPILLVTARGDVASILEGFDAGANDYLLKPFHGRELLARVDVHVRLRRMLQQIASHERHAMLGVLAASVAHQVRNPLTTLISGLPAMRAKLGDKMDNRTLDLMEIMIECAERVERLTIDLMDLSRVDREATSRFRISDGLSAAVRLLRARLEDGMRMEESIAESPVIDGRPGDMNHVFMNLLDNAIRAVRPSGVIRVDAGMENDVYVIRVADSGRGVDSEVISRIFEPFFTTRSAGDGTGLGLAIAKSVVEHHGGTISVGQSDLGGALFMVRIPTTSDSAGTGSSSKDSAQLAQRSLQG